MTFSFIILKTSIACKMYSKKVKSSEVNLEAVNPTLGKTAYHNKCAPEPKQPPQRTGNQQPRAGAGGAPGAGGAAGVSGRHTRADYRECNSVIEDKTWRETVGREKKGQIRWDEGWGFLRDFDQKGNPKVKPEPPENLTLFSESVPNTSNQRFGHRQKTGAAKAMVDLQHRLSTTNRKKHHKELVCYD
ncbi:uncharacterized protein C2orf50-like isoform X1 [Lytechinus variegatus]|uniref:uncharacterized protein C2orf50-like isoform X1 n=1 Tax=Lytechinus variegatus TaxID=7654 RepID=UPI001BB2AC91|nr:uncharacterized protein C2orf50-like isoform X1 [Lytechinus variegatus]